MFCATFNPQGTIVASGSFDETVRLWDVRSGRCLRTIAVHSDPVTSVDFSGDGTLFVTGSYDGLARVWDTSSSQCLRTLVSEESGIPVSHARFSPNEQFVLAATLNGRLRLWDYAQDTCVRTFTGHKNNRFCVTPTFVQVAKQQHQLQSLVACGSEDGRLVLWDVESREPALVTSANDTMTLWHQVASTSDAP